MIHNFSLPTALKRLSLKAFVLMLLLLPSLASAGSAGATISEGLQQAGTSYDTSYSLPEFIGGIIASLLSIVGMIFLIMTVYAGVMYMTAAGDEGKIKKAKSILTTSLIGIIIIVGAYALTNFVINQLIIAEVTSS